MSDTKLIHLTTPLGPDVLLPYRVNAIEELGRPFRHELELLSEDPGIKLEDLLGKTVTLSVDLPNGKTRWFNGHVTRFSMTGRTGRYVRYQATLRPWLWFLSRAADARTFGNGTQARAMKTAEIAKAVFRKHGFSAFEEKLQGVHLPRTYCVQYRESDLDFVSRLFEESGIYYFFRHEDGAHTLVLADAPSSHAALEAYHEIPFLQPGGTPSFRGDHVFEWQLTQEVQTGEVGMRDFDFVSPAQDLTSASQASRTHEHGKLAWFEPSGEYVETYEVASSNGRDNDAQDRGRAYAKLRLEEHQSRFERVRGMGSAAGMAVGGLFQLTDFHREDQNREYLVVSTQHELQVAGYEGVGGSGGETVVRCSFTAMPGDVPFRPERLTPRPVINGPQTATVVGKAGEEIWTDKHGRVKLQFHWDRAGKKDEDSSCWVRVSQPWAGQNWGGVTIPRVGQEVIVEFIDGDPDRPIVTGRVYNGQQTPPYALPDNATQSGLKSRSSKGGGPANFNEIRFEDKKGAEEVYFHAEKDHNVVVENDHTESIGRDEKYTIDHDQAIEVKNNRAKKVGVDQSETIGANKKISVGANHDETIGSNMTLKIGSAFTESIAASHSETCGGAHTESVAADHTVNVGGSRTETIGSSLTQTVAIASTEMVGAAKSVAVGASYSVNVGANLSLATAGTSSTTTGGNSSENVGGNATEDVGGDKSVSAGKSLTVKAGAKGAVQTAEDLALQSGTTATLSAKKIGLAGSDEVVLGSGNATITLKKNGEIVLEGKNITVKGSGTVVIKGSKIQQNP